MNTARIQMYDLLSRLYKKEIDETWLNALATTDLGLVDHTFESGKVTAEDLAVDFARVFLAAGISEGHAAFPYESVYTSKKKLMMQDAWVEMKGLLDQAGLVSENTYDLKEDHISCELSYMSYLIQSNASTDVQKNFFESHLLNWIPLFVADVKQYAETWFYKAVAKLTLNFLEEENQLFSQQNNAAFFNVLKNKYLIYAPKQQKDVIRYGKINTFEEIVFDQQSDFSPKEVYYPVSQTMFLFTENEVIEQGSTDQREILIFARPCDIHAMKRLDSIFLKNGEQDYYYGQQRKRIKIAMIECLESFDDCFCVSLGTNMTSEYDMAIRLEDNKVKIHIKNDEIGNLFKKENVSITDFEPAYVTENKKKLNVPNIPNRDTLKWVSNHDYWNQYDEKCIGCGGCSTVCGSCSCFDTVDIIYNEGSKEGERKRVWSSCMLADFTETAGGARARKTPGANMRFKTLHKFYDYKERFGDTHMCVGCGRCTRKCPEDIDFFQVVDGLTQILKERE